jgi:hypothetical protein
MNSQDTIGVVSELPVLIRTLDIAQQADRTCLLAYACVYTYIYIHIPIDLFCMYIAVYCVVYCTYTCRILHVYDSIHVY